MSKSANSLNSTVQIVLSGVILLICVVMVYPFIWMISASFKEVSEMFRIPPTIIPDAPTLHNYQIVFEKMGVLANMYKNSLIVATSITVIQTVISSMAAFAFAKLKFPGKNAIFILFMCALMIPVHLTIIPNFILMRQLRLIDSLASLILLGSFSAFGIFLLRQFYMTIPQELHDAARIDGCNFLQSFLYVHLPLSRSIVAVNAILTFNAAWSDFFTPLIFSKSLDRMTLPLGISLIQGVYSQQSPAVMVTTLVVALVPVIIVFLLARRQLIESITTTGLKR